MTSDDPTAFDRARFGRSDPEAVAYRLTDVDGSVIAECPVHGRVYLDDAYEPAHRLVDALRTHEGKAHR